jgi:D-alanine-D-alanine ligase
MIPYVGPGVIGSAIGMHKDIFKEILAQHKIPVAPFIATSDNKIDYLTAKTQLSSDILFIKPAAMGSSVGVTKASNESDFRRGLETALTYSQTVLIERAIIGREIECSILGNKNPIASCLGELKPTHEFYSYDAKYKDPNGALYFIPAENISENVIKKMQAMAIKVFQLSKCVGMARVDFFLTPSDEIYVNEINTLPGFTSISMYPKLFEQSGISYSDLLTKLISLAEEQYSNILTLSTI